ncbi:hypothetical protein Egran_03421 [Elaphomyces granulatus]|uniref:Bromo domain-containing protein n=1 Tax=Elaphomyces granulatus TaxID=519963 RepID=A0A232LYC1_9EURO|nr:hypothetical protein Egran_03421 [Elaphomyces granulatus]
MSNKRRGAAAASPDSTSHGLKRRKVSDDFATIETPQTTTEAGLKLLLHIKQSTDKNGRQIATSFLRLPDRRRNPDYYKSIVMPIAINTIEEKLKRHKYPNLTALEGDLKRMVSNAKSYNERSSLIFADAERIRKLLSNSMPKINPAYKNPKYVALPTPLPDEGTNDASNIVPNKQEREPATSPTSTRRTSKSGDSQVARLTPPMEDHSQSEGSFEGDTLREAQDKIMSELIHLKDSNGQEIATPFINKPDRSLYKEYYGVIQHPVSLRSIQKQVRGSDGKNALSKFISFPTWQSFENEVEFIWRNAREFNEDGSEVFMLAGVLEDYFKRRVAEAKRVVRDSTQTNNNGTRRLRLRVGASTPEPPPQRLTLKLPGQKAGVTKEKKPQSGMSVDNESLKRQQDLVKAGSKGQDIRDTPPISRSLRLPPASPTSSAGKGTGPQAQKRRSSASSPARSALATGEAQTLPSPSSAVVPSRENSQESGKPAAVSPGPISSVGSAPRSSIPPMPPPSSITRRHQSNSPCHLNNPAPNPQTGLNNSSNALISNISIFTHPRLKLRHGIHLDVPPSSTACQQGLIIPFHPSHHLLSLRPSVADSTVHRTVKLVVSRGTQTLCMSAPSQESVPGPTYDVQLGPGVTTLDFEVIAGPRGASKCGPPGHGIEYERVTLYLQLLPS